MADPFTASLYVVATTDIALPLGQRYAPQWWSELRGGFPKDTSPRVWCVGDIPEGLEVLGEKGDGGPLLSITTARVGAGVCMAVRRNVLVEVGPSDPALNAGTSTRGGRDLDMFVRILATDDVIIHMLDVLVYRRYRVDEVGLSKQIRGNGPGMATLLMRAIIVKPFVLGTLATRAPGVPNCVKPGGAHVAGIDEDVLDSLTKSEIKSFPEGPFLCPSSCMHGKLGTPRQTERAPVRDSVTVPSNAEEAQASSTTETTGEGNGNT